jgi:TolB-like protein
MTAQEFRLGTLTLQPGRQLLANGAPLQLSRKPLQILSMLADARGELVTKDELLKAIWPGQVVEESALQAHIVALRKALGAEAGHLKTVHGFGYRLELPSGTAPHIPLAPLPTAQPSIAVLPFRALGGEGKHAIIADALPHELIAQLSRLRWLFVIARASSFQFREPNPDLQQVGARLGVSYCLSGTLHQEGRRIAITVELVDTRSQQVIWGDHYSAGVEGVHELRASIVASILSALEFQIPLHEAQMAALGSSEHLDAWSLYHLALQRVFRFTRSDNEAACALFEQAITLDPGFARAHAGLSFAMFQNAFMHYVVDTDREAIAARRSAERAIELDEADPFANLVFGRALWLRGDIGGSIPWIDRALTLNPNYAQGAYAHAFADALLCHGAEGRRHAERAMALSPIDPMYYAMMGARALSHAVRGETAEAADWSGRAARAPNSHVLIAMIAAMCHQLAHRESEALAWANAVRARSPESSQSVFFRAFPFEQASVRRTFSQALSSLGF